MTLGILTDCRIWGDDYDLSGTTNKVEIGGSCEAKKITNFNSGRYDEYLAGLKEVEVNVSGFFEGTTSDAFADEFLGARVPVTIAVDDAAGSIAYMGGLNVLSAPREFAVGEVGVLNFGAKGAGATMPGIVRGALLYPKTTITTTTTSTGIQYGAIGSGRTIWAAVHVFGATSGDTLDVKIQSDDNSGFTSATDRITFTQFAAATGSEVKSLAAPITDDYWRIVATVAGNGSESFSLGVFFGSAPTT